jgi:hypothetical protein
LGTIGRRSRSNPHCLAREKRNGIKVAVIILVASSVFATTAIASAPCPTLVDLTVGRSPLQGSRPRQLPALKFVATATPRFQAKPILSWTTGRYAIVGHKLVLGHSHCGSPTGQSVFKPRCGTVVQQQTSDQPLALALRYKTRWSSYESVSMTQSLGFPLQSDQAAVRRALLCLPSFAIASSGGRSLSQ